MNESKVLKLVSLDPYVSPVRKADQIELEEQTEDVIIASFLVDRERAIGEIGELVDAVYENFSEACNNKNLNWEAEIQVGLEFGITFSARLKITPKDS